MNSTHSISSNALVWFRHDLRIDDNQSLVAACHYAAEHQGLVRAIFFVTPKQWALHDAAPIQLDFIEKQVNQLAIELADLGIPLDICHSDSFEAMPALLSQYVNYWQISKVFATSEPECNEQRRDNAVIEAGVDLELSQQHCVLAPLSVLNLAGEMYKVFTPFAKKWREIAKQAPIQTLTRPTAIAAPLATPNYVEFECDKSCSLHWPVGELAAQAKLRQFAKGKVADYQASRDFPAIDGTSQLSAYLTIGVLSPRQCLQALLSHYPDALVHDDSPGRCWLNELVWREFYRHLLVAFPKLSKGANFNALADQIKWRNNKQEFQAWCEGRTGYPLVDAAMRQLNQTGWMHNRLRMVTASFLTKHLLVDWRWGERYFRQKLIDGDLAANNGGWQWSAGTGCDAQPYFRVFNPISQCEKFDPTGAFIRTYLPELKSVELKLIHKLKIHSQAQLFVDTDYAFPIVDHKFARTRAIAVLSAMKKGSAKALQVKAQQVRVQQVRVQQVQAQQVRQVGSDSGVDLDKEIFG